jgi:small subunit ribosomal protein MRP21
VYRPISLPPHCIVAEHTSQPSGRCHSRAMDLMKARETMMRSSQSLLPFLAHREPARRTAFVSRHCRAQPLNASTSRSFATSMRRQQDDDSNNAASAVKSAPEPRARRPSISEDISSILDGALDMKKGTPTAPSARTSRFPSRNAQSTSSPARAQLTEDKQQQQKQMGSSVADLMAGFQAPVSRNTGKRDIAGSLNPRGNRSGPPPVPQPAPMKLGPTLGRTVHVDNQRGIDVARAFRSMEIQVAKNSVRKEFARQKFHERPGKKRKRLHSERWRKRFKAGFKATVKRVLKMRKQGW